MFDVRLGDLERGFRGRVRHRIDSCNAKAQGGLISGHNAGVGVNTDTVCVRSVHKHAATNSPSGKRT